MFEKTRKTLTVFYSGIIGIILLIMVFSFYFSLSAVISTNVRGQLQSITDRMAHEWKEHAEGEDMSGFDWDFLQPNQFVLVLDRNHQPLLDSFRGEQQLLSQELLACLDSQPITPDTFGHVSLAYGNGTRSFSIYRTSLQTADGTNNVLYVGDDTTRMDDLLDEMRWLLGITAIVLLGLGTLAGYAFAGRAMVPITQAYTRQKEFTADASHELRTPLSIMLSSAEIIAENKDSLPPFHQNVLTGMLNEIARMIRLVENMLSLARSDSDNALAVNGKPFDLVQTAKDVIGQLQIQANPKNISLSLQHDGLQEPLLFFGDPDQIRQLLYILIDNGIKYTNPNGFVHLSVSAYKHKKVKITVQDNGVGIPAEDLPHIFDRFYRVDKGRSRATGGTGLGLAIAAQIVSSHHGKITVTSHIGQGTTYTIIL